MPTYDVVVLGEGVAAFAAAKAAVQQKCRTAWGTTNLRGPEHTVRQWVFDQVVREAAAQVVRQGCQPPDFARLATRGAEGASRWIQPYQPETLKAAGVDVFLGSARFLDDKTILVGETPLRFRRLFLEPPLRPGPLPWKGVEEVGSLTDQNLLQLDQLPGRVAILGHGSWECQWAQNLQRLGAQVVLISTASTLLPEEFSEGVVKVQRAMESEGVRLVLGCDSVRVEQIGTQRAVVFELHGIPEKFFIDQVIYQKPLVSQWSDLGFEEGKIQSSAGEPNLDRFGRTSNPRVWVLPYSHPLDVPGLSAVDSLVQKCVRNAFLWCPWKKESVFRIRYVGTDPAIVRFGLWPETHPLVQGSVVCHRMESTEGEEMDFGGREPVYGVVYVDRERRKLVEACVVAREPWDLVGPLLIVTTGRGGWEGLAGLEDLGPRRVALLAQLAELGAWRRVGIFQDWFPRGRRGAVLREKA